MIINQYQNYMYNSKLLEQKFIKNSNNNFTILKDNLFFRNITFQNFLILKINTYFLLLIIILFFITYTIMIKIIFNSLKKEWKKII